MISRWPFVRRGAPAPERGAVTLAVWLVLAAACGPADAQRSGTSAERAAESQPRAAKVLTLAKTEGQITDFPGVTGRQPGGVEYIVHNFLVLRDDRDEFVPQLAAEQLSVERGTWRINPDGTMDTTWRIRPNVRWHDGTPFTSADLRFTFTAFKDPELPSRYGSALRLMESATAPDPLTFTIRWSRALATANEAPGLNPMAKHSLEEVYLHDRANFANNPRLAAEFVGLGAYRLAHWERGSHMELVRFDDYYLGRPPLDRVIVRFISDPNTVAANLMSGAIDAAWGDRVDLDAAVELKQRWAGTGHQVRFAPLADLQQVEIQYRPEHARPLNGLTNRTVRTALYHAIDRPALVEAVSHGLAAVADSWFAPNYVLFPNVQDVVPLYRYDPALAQRLLAEAGWTRGGDGLLSSPTGERFELQVFIQEAKSEEDQAIAADYWRAVGVQAIQARLPIPRDRQVEATQPGVIVTSPKGYEVPFLDSSRLYAGNISSAANRWTGRNRGGYSNPRADAILERLSVTIDLRETVPLHRDLLREAMGDVALIPLYFDVNSIVTLKGIKGPIGGTYPDWNFFQWDRD